MSETAILNGIIAVIGTVVWYLLRQKDANQEEQIRVLFLKHDEDAKALQELRVQIAEAHYKKTELDPRFDRLESTFRNGFDALGAKFDHLTAVLISHVSKEDSGK